MERVIPDLHRNKLLNVLFEEEEERTEENYLIHLWELEKECDAFLLDLLEKLNFQASVKGDRYSLPYQKEIEYTIPGSSFLSEAFDIRQVARGIVARLLQENVYKLRFYFFINIVAASRSAAGVLPFAAEDPERFQVHFGAVNYRFRYYVHDR